MNTTKQSGADIQQDIEQLRQELLRHDAQEPRPPLQRLALMQEPTIEAFMDALSTRSRCASVLSAEAGGFFGGHAMKGENRAKAFATYNVAHDGGIIAAERRTAGTVRVERPAVTCGFSLQPSTFHAFRAGVEGLDRGTGFIARVLFSNPESTQGTRKFREPPESLPALTAFRDRIKQRLSDPLTYDENGTLSPPVLSFTPEAKTEWIDFYNEVENELGPGGEMSEAKDIASKAADNVARLAALLHVFEHGPAGNIGEHYVQAATRIVTWHLYQARREFCELAPTPEMLNAQKLEAWLIRRFREHGELQVERRDAMKFGPGSTRHRAELDAALAVLTKAKRARTVRPPGTRTELIEVNPALLEGA